MHGENPVVYAYINELALNFNEQTLPLVVLAAIAGKGARHTSSIFRFLWARDGALYEIQYGILLWRMELDFQMGIPMFKSIE